MFNKNIAKCLSILALISIMTLMFTATIFADGPDIPGPIEKGNGTIDIGPQLRVQDKKSIAEFEAQGYQKTARTQATQVYTVGDTLNWLALDEVDPGNTNLFQSYFETEYTVKYIGNNCEVWVQNDLNYYNADGTLNMLHPDASDPIYVTDARIQSLGNVCDTIIQPNDVEFYGMYQSLDGSDSGVDYLNGVLGSTLSDLSGNGDHIVLLVMNIREDNFYDPITNPSFYAGFYSPTFEYWGDRNFITIDSKQWNLRVGAGDPSAPLKAYTFDSTIAHELQHLIHDDYDSTEDSWVNEGLSEYAEFLIGYRTDENHSRTQWQTWPENSLVLWGDQDNDQAGGVETLADYQLAYLFTMYTAGRLGGDTFAITSTATLNRETGVGIVGYNNWIQNIDPTLNFRDLFNDFRTEMLYGGYSRDAQPISDWNSGFMGSYVSPLESAGGPATEDFYLGLLRDSLGSQGYSTPGAPPYGSDYLQIFYSPAITASQTVLFDGDESAIGTAWAETPIADATGSASNTTAATGDVWYSGHTDLEDNFAVFGPFTIAGGNTLAFDQFYNIEETWDYGFVQVTTDTTGLTGWTSLELPGVISTTDTSAHPIIVDNVPGFSGNLEAWEHQSYDLSAYAGQNILVAFRYATDWGGGGNTTDYPSGWAIDNLTVGGTEAVDPRSIQEVRDAGNKFAVDLVTYADGDSPNLGTVYPMTIDNATQTGSMDLGAIVAANAGFNGLGERAVFVISNYPPTFDDLISGGLVAQYGEYTFTNLPSSLNTESSVVGNGGGDKVYPDGVFTVTVTTENVGASSDGIANSGSVDVDVCTEVPTQQLKRTQIGDPFFSLLSFSDNVYTTTNMATIDGAFPAYAGICFSGPITDSETYNVVFASDPKLNSGQKIDTRTYSNKGVPVVTSTTTVKNPMINSALSMQGAYANGTATFTLLLINTDDQERTLQVTFTAPESTTIVGMDIGTQEVEKSSGDSVTLNPVLVKPYVTNGGKQLNFTVKLNSDITVDDELIANAEVKDITTEEITLFQNTGMVGQQIYLPIISRE